MALLMLKVADPCPRGSRGVTLYVFGCLQAWRVSCKFAFSCFRASTMDLCIVSTKQLLTVCCLNDSSVRRDKGVLFSLDWISYYHVERN